MLVLFEILSVSGLVPERGTWAQFDTPSHMRLNLLMCLKLRQILEQLRGRLECELDRGGLWHFEDGDPRHEPG